jgi:hypothetical protein
MKLENILGKAKMDEEKLYEMAMPVIAQKLKDPQFAALMNNNPDAAAAQLTPIVMTATDKTPLDYDRVLAILKAKFGITVKSPGAVQVLQKATAAKPTAQPQPAARPAGRAPAQPATQATTGGAI